MGSWLHGGRAAPLPSSLPAHPAAPADQLMADAAQPNRPSARATPVQVPGSHRSCRTQSATEQEQGEGDAATAAATVQRETTSVPEDTRHMPARMSIESFIIEYADTNADNFHDMTIENIIKDSKLRPPGYVVEGPNDDNEYELVRVSEAPQGASGVRAAKQKGGGGAQTREMLAQMLHDDAQQMREEKERKLRQGLPGSSLAGPPHRRLRT